MFWGANLKSGDEYDFKTHVGKILTISNACLNENSGEGSLYLQVVHRNQTFGLCHLAKNKAESHNLNNTLVVEDGMKLTVKGAKGTVSLTGFFENELNEGILGDEEKPKVTQTPQPKTKDHKEVKEAKEPKPAPISDAGQVKKQTPPVANNTNKVEKKPENEKNKPVENKTKEEPKKKSAADFINSDDDDEDLLLDDEAEEGEDDDDDDVEGL
jgi:hypothetical protein